MEKRAFLAVLLSLAILIGWQVLFPPPPPPEPVASAAASPPAPPVPETTPPAPDPVPEAPAPPAEPVQAGSLQDLTVETDLAEVTFTNAGGRVLRWRLKDYLTAQGPLDIVHEPDPKREVLPLGLDLDDPVRTREVNAALYEVDRSSTPEGERVRFTWADPAGLRVEKTFTFSGRDPLVRVEAAVTDRGRPLPVRLVWGSGFQADKSGPQGSFHYVHQVVRNRAGQVARTPAKAVDASTLDQEGGLVWAGLEDQHFAALVIPAGNGATLRIWPTEVPAPAPESGQPAAEPVREPSVAVGLPEGRALLFVGPKKERLLSNLGHQLDKVIWYSNYSLLYVLAKYLFALLLWIHDAVVPNYGWAIVLATFALRVVFFPLNQFSMTRMRQSAADMARVQPKLKAIQAKWKKSKDPEARAKMNEETMALYRKEGVNPMSSMTGCLPMLIQLPILIAFYNVLTVAVELRGAPFFGWIQDLSLKDPWYVTPLLMGATMFVQQKMSLTPGGDPAQQRIMMFMPVIFTVMFLNLPSGLVLYWFVNNLLGIAQQWLVNRRLEGAAAAARV